MTERPVELIVSNALMRRMLSVVVCPGAIADGEKLLSTFNPCKVARVAWAWLVLVKPCREVIAPAGIVLVRFRGSIEVTST